MIFDPPLLKYAKLFKKVNINEFMNISINELEMLENDSNKKETMVANFEQIISSIHLNIFGSEE